MFLHRLGMHVGGTMSDEGQQQHGHRESHALEGWATCAQTFSAQVANLEESDVLMPLVAAP